MIRYEDEVRKILAGTYPPAGIEVWLATPNAAFEDRSARQMIALGYGETVVRRAEYIAGGAW